MLFQGSQHTAHLSIEILQHGYIGVRIGLHPVFFSDLLFGILRSLKRKVRALVRDKQEERLLLMALNEINRRVRYEMRHVTLRMHRQASAEEHVQLARLTMIEVVHVAAKVPEEFIPPMLHRVKTRLVAEMPFAKHTARVAGLFQCPRQHHLLRRQAQLPSGGQRDGVVVPPHVARADGAFQPARPLRIPPREQRRSRGTAFRAVGIMLGKPHPLLRQPINHRRLRPRMAVATEIAVTHVVGQNEDDVGRRGLKQQAQCQSKKRKQEAH